MIRANSRIKIAGMFCLALARFCLAPLSYAQQASAAPTIPRDQPLAGSGLNMGGLHNVSRRGSAWKRRPVPGLQHILR